MSTPSFPAQPVASVSSMLCPLCHVPLNMSERQGVEIDYCPQCRGVWLDRGELDKIIERNAQIGGSALPQRPTFRPDRAPIENAPQPENRLHYEEGERQKRTKSFLEELFD